MSLLFRILRAAHARGTHHKLALDALHRMRHPDAEKWERVFLEHAELYMQGAKAPDDEFKDFQNHVLHPRDKYWGGAPEKVESWFNHLVAALKAGNWSEAVWCAGVLSHYATDPVHPFHTAQSQAENNIHRAAEWSINRAYNELWSDAIVTHKGLDVAIPAGPHGLKAMICAAADRANADYERLIAHYDIHRGVVDPPSGLDPIARKIVGELLVHAATLHARLIDHAIAVAGVAPPQVSLALDTIVAALKIPVKALLKKIADKEDRRQVEAMYDELVATGRVETTLPEDDRLVRELHAREVLAPRLARQADARAARIPTSPEATRKKARAAAARALKPVMPRAVARGGHLIADAAPSGLKGDPGQGEQVAAGANPGSDNTKIAAFAAALAAPASGEPPRQPGEALSSLTRARLDVTAGGGQRAHAAAPSRINLARSDALETAPSIGPKTAGRFAEIGIRTVAEFLAADPEGTAKRLAVRHITAATVAEWQDQARLVMAVPGLRGTHAQLLTGAGCRTAEAVAAITPEELCARILAFAATHDGQRILRDGHAPDIEKIKEWVDHAAAAVAA